MTTEEVVNPGSLTSSVYDNNRHTHSQSLWAVYQDHPILSTAKDRKFTEDTVVEINGGEMTIAQAKQYGFLKDDLSMPQGNEVSAQQTSREEITCEPEGSLEIDANAMDTIADWSLSLQASGANPVHIVSQVINDPDKLPQALTDLAMSNDIDRMAVLEQQKSLIGQVEQSLAEYTASKGVQDLGDWWKHSINTYGHQVVVSALTNEMFLNDSKALDDLIHNYLVAHNFNQHGKAKDPQDSGWTTYNGVQTSQAAARNMMNR